MHLGKSYKLSEFLFWTRRQIYALALWSLFPVILFRFFGMTWLSVPLTIVGLLGTAASFIVGFKNVQTYNRAMEAQAIWTDIVSASRRWGQLARDLPDDESASVKLVERHLAWLTALRYALRRPRVWESMNAGFNAEFGRRYRVPEWERSLDETLIKYVSASEITHTLDSPCPATALLSTQGAYLKSLHAEGKLNTAFYLELRHASGDFITLQAKAERLKNFPYPRQYATVSALFVRFFCLLFPFGLLSEFDKLNDSVSGFMHGNMIWIVVPCSVAVSWMYTSLEQVGESTENPFEGSANDVPISTLSAQIERDLRSMLGERTHDFKLETIAM